MAERSQARRTPKAQTFGDLALAAIRRAIERTTEVSKALPLPGEGDERPFRNWLRSNLLVPVLNWPEDSVRAGEGFDILLLDEHNNEVATIETKAPFHTSTRGERDSFMDRLSKLPRLRVAYFTNGPEWDRLDLVAPDGVQEIRDQVSLDISEATAEEAESFFTPLRGDRYFHWGQRNRSLVARSHPHILEQLARDLDKIVGDSADVLSLMFERFEGGNAGAGIQRLTRDIFDDWCRRSLQAPVSQVIQVLGKVLQVPEAERAHVTVALRSQGFTPQVAEAASDRLLASRPEERSDPDFVRAALAPTYRESVVKLCAQSAHLLLARCLVYRVGEDMGLFTPLIGGEAMEEALAPPKATLPADPFPALSLTETVRRRMVGILPLVYQLSDLDWWLVPEEKQATLEPSVRAVVRECERELDLSISRLLRTLDGFHFAKVDADVWRNVYQHYLPAEERQRLGGFYTPEVLVEFILDLAGFTSSAENLCSRTLLDPACGSGAFVTIAAARLLDHLSKEMPCHTARRPARSRPGWQHDKTVLNTVIRNVHAVDLHPFAAFLTTLNLTFLLLPLYATVHDRNPNFSLALQVFSADSLEKPDEHSIAPELFDQLNSRIQLSAESAERYRSLVSKKFDLVVGNPPWGGVLKGPLAPVYDEMKKSRFKREYPHGANGKYDIYGLFMERALQLLAEGGRCAMVTQDTYMDKNWAKKLRRLLANETQVQSIVGLNPFGQLFFHAMNTPAITVFDNKPPAGGSLVSLTTRAPKFEDKSQNERRSHVVNTVRSALAAVSGRRRTVERDFCTAARLPRRLLRETAERGWDLRPGASTPKFKRHWLRVTDILEPRQGVTPGGCLDVFLLSDQQAKTLALEARLVRQAIKSRETERWNPNWQGRVLLYPYVVKAGKAVRAFAVRHRGLSDALDFEVILDDQERRIRHGRSLNNAAARDILEHRIALDLVKYPQAARYLVDNYVRLEGRIFEKQPLTHRGKRWYEYHRPRDIKQLLTGDRILSPRLTRKVCFSIDSRGFLADDACQYLIPSAKLSKPREELRLALSRVMERPILENELLQYCLAFLNSHFAQQALARRKPTPKGSYQISKQYLSELPVVLPTNREDAETILDTVGQLVRGVRPRERPALEARLETIVSRVLA